MILRPIAMATAALMFLLPAVPASAAAPPGAPASGAPREAGGAKALIRNCRFEEALAILRPLVRGGTVDADTLFLYGLAAIDAARKPGLAGEARDVLLDEAIAAFRTMLVGRPELVCDRLELGLACPRHGNLIVTQHKNLPMERRDNRAGPQLNDLTTGYVSWQRRGKGWLDPSKL